MGFNINMLKEERYLIPLKIVAVYVGWKVFYHFASIEGSTLHIAWVKLCTHIGSWYAAVTSAILTRGGIYASADGININLLAYHKQIWVLEHCLAIPAMVVFTGAVVFFKGSWRDKAWFIPLGLAGIVLLNILRLTVVSIAWVRLTPYFFYFHHTFVYAIGTYAFILLLLVWWMRRQKAA